MQIFSYILISIGVLCLSISSIGILRFTQDKIAKIHAISVTDIVGLPLIFAGILMQDFSIALMLKILLMILILWISSSTSGYIIARIIQHDS